METREDFDTPVYFKKIIQIADSTSDHYSAMTALCEDGTVWINRLYLYRDGSTKYSGWTQIPGIPDLPPM